MTVYSVYEPSDAPSGQGDAGAEARAEKIAFVKEGFAWIALIVPILWLIYHRMWLELLAFLAVFLSLPAIFGNDPVGKDLAGWASLGLTVLFAFEANDLRAWALRRRGFRFAGTAWGRDQTEAETRFFTRWLPEQAQSQPAVPADLPVPAKSPAIVPTRPLGGDEVIGSFPRS
ncbi:hypothetical protein AUC68_12520 [Methyloceanibacter methanicus]|uniref:DUF2628 domain-containing protein n=1 Tax=Methyloceanibacter methanicus TaxID=1774968 RepID=A0A1E3W7U3_9HYPH|nr:DUF2628 domain-containing protein [Methyloceanibacter methanicus]ODS01187.1 hypothetical protein AUC68_12520 [Methyloceanibacter methanicus]